MVSKEDWAAAMSSEVFREYMAAEMKKQAATEVQQREELLNKVVDKDQVLSELSQLEAHINNNPKLLKAFSILRQKFIEDPEYTSKVDPLFVRGVLMLDLQDQD